MINISMDRVSIWAALLFFLLLISTPSPAQEKKTEPPPPKKENLLQLLGIIPCPESEDYVQNKTQFQLHTLLTEQRHPKTWNLSQQIQKDYKTGLALLLAVDEDITAKLQHLNQNHQELDRAMKAVEKALLSHRKIYIYGCGATGRLAKQMESTFWRPFWHKLKNEKKIWLKIKNKVGQDVEERLIGEMTGGDRALISSLEGFEDLQLIGRLQLQDRRISMGDVVICVTEGGETSSVIGTILAALEQWQRGKNYNAEISRQFLFFVYNNPDEKLLPFNRSRKVLQESGISKINLTTGPQAITGSTRMQATTIETFVIGHIIQTAVENVLRNLLSPKEMNKIGFKKTSRLEDRLKNFAPILSHIKECLPQLDKLTELETTTYTQSHFSTYFAQKGLITVFIDSTERSPTFHLYPLDTIKEKKRKCWIQVWTGAASLGQAWLAFLGRPFRGLSPAFYQKPFGEQIKDPFLKKAALTSLQQAGDEQRWLYDFSFSEFNLKKRGPRPGDLGVAVLLTPEEKELRKKDSYFRRFMDLFIAQKTKLALICLTDKNPEDIFKTIKKTPYFKKKEKNVQLIIPIETDNDPFGLNQQIALKMLLNAHSTGVMARLGKVIGNTMANVSPSNLKLIGRATYLIQSHVNDILSRPQWVKVHGLRKPITYGEANAVLFEAIHFLQDKKQEVGQTAEVALSIIRILESLRLNRGISNSEALAIVNKVGLSRYLSQVGSQQLNTDWFFY